MRFACESAADQLCGRIRLPNQIRVAHNSADLRAYALNRSAFAVQYREHLLQDLWLMLLKETYGNPEPGSKSARIDPVMQQVKAYLEEHAFEPLQLKNVAAAYQLTPVQLSRSFQACYGQKPIAFITELRMQQAIKLLMTKNWTVEAIAQACSYENGFYLSRVFSKNMKLSPSAFRKENRV
ncbi:helix-turn-helix domain-containing protein [Cohnella hongkongensis]|uniref:Helix-turn-helix domain-containing protein n=1 Tax=Cohnella hongkongensis TaxID=178337 RepID=A0ABV9FHF9_9BACL